jgi:hypothetical protein
MSALNWFAGRFGIRRPKVAHPYANYVEQGQQVIGEQKATQDGYYCTACGYNFGLNMPPYRGQCPEPTCGNPHGTVAQDESSAEDEEAAAQYGAEADDQPPDQDAGGSAE